LKFAAEIKAKNEMGKNKANFEIKTTLQIFQN
jgi:hypothetical protein